MMILMTTRTVASETEFTIIGKTYEAKELIKSSGFRWDKENQRWIGDANAKSNIEAEGNPARGRKNAKLVNALKIGPVYHDIETDD